jgi:hypothetical protein
MKNENDNPDSTDRAVSGQEQSSRKLDASRRDFLKVSGGVLAVGMGTGLAGSAVAAEGETLLVDNYDGNPSWPSQNDLGKWTGAGGFANGDGEIVDGTLRLEYDGAGWFASNVGQDVSAYDRLELVVRGGSGGEEKDFQVKIGSTAGALADFTDDSIGTSFSTVSIDLAAAGVDRTALSSIRFNFWNGARSRSSAIEVEEIRFASGSGDEGDTGDQSSVTKPANLTVTNTTASSIAVNWDPSSASGTSVDHYVVTAGGNSMSIPAGTTQATIDSLESGTSYTVRVTAVGADGTKSDATTVSATTETSGGGGNQTVSVQLSNGTVNPDGTTTASIMLSGAPNGVAGYDLTLGVANAGVATVTDATIPDTFIAPGGGISIADDGSSVTIRAADLQQNIQSGATDITLATVTLTGQSAGETGLSLSVDTIDDDNGSSMSLSTAGATLSVTGGDTGDGSEDDNEGGSDGPTVDVQLSNGTVNPDGTTTASIMLSEAPNGVAGYDLTLNVANAGVATVTDATIPDTFIAPGGGISIANDGSSVTIRAADLQQNIQSGATDITLATVTLTGQSSGTTQVNLSIDTIDDDNGSSMSLSTSGATLSVS